MLGFHVTKEGTLNRRLIESLIRVKGRVDRAVEKVGFEILMDSLDRVPRDTEALAKSAGLHFHDYGLLYVVVVGYGDPYMEFHGWSNQERKTVDRYPYEYAVYVHEGAPGQYPSGEQDFLRTPATNLPFMISVLHAGLGI